MERKQELKNREKYCEMLSSGCNMTVVHMISHQAWIATKDLHKIQPVENPNIEQSRDLRTPLQLSSDWQLVATSVGNGYWLIAMSQATMTSQPLIYRQH